MKYSTTSVSRLQTNYKALLQIVTGRNSKYGGGPGEYYKVFSDGDVMSCVGISKMTLPNNT